jgi:hypothetical protein
MKTLFRIAAVSLALAASSALADPSVDPCGKGMMAEGMRARVGVISAQMDKIDLATSRAEQRMLLELHMKQMQEGLHELRMRKLPAECRIELLSSMMESMMRAQLVAHADDR